MKKVLIRPDRRNFLKGSGAVVAGTLAGHEGALAAEPIPARKKSSAAVSQATGSSRQTLLFFTDEEADFINAAIDLLLPKDEYGPGAVELGVLTYLDRQLAGAYGAGARDYRQGPFAMGGSTQGYQLSLSPAELYRHFIRIANRECIDRHGSPFSRLPTKQRQGLLKVWEKNEVELDGIPSKLFFEQLLINTMEGYFSDPIHGGNRGAASWKMIGFPGGNPVLNDVVESQNRPYRITPITIASE